MEVKFYEQTPDYQLNFAVIFAKAHGKWVVCRLRQRDTYELPGGHREAGESILDAASRDLREETGLDPDISWSDTGKIQLGNEVTATLTSTVNLGLFGEFASFPVTLTARATGVSEVYWK